MCSDDERMPYTLARARAYIAGLEEDAPDLPDPGSWMPELRVQPPIGPAAGAVLSWLVRLHRPQRILEIGTGLGHGACLLGRAARGHGGRVTTIEIDPRLAAIAASNVASVGLEEVVEIVTGDARHVVPDLEGRFGLILQDGDKPDYFPLLDPLLALLDPGGILASDDVLFPVMDLPAGAVAWGQAMAQYNQVLAGRTDLRTVWLPVGDGLALTTRA